MLPGNDEHVARVAQLELLEQVDALVHRVAVVQGGDAAHRLRPEARARPIGGAGVERHADEGRLVVLHLAHVLAIRRLHEGVDAGERRLMAAAEQRDGAVVDRGGRLEAELEGAADLFVLLRSGRRRRAASGCGCRGTLRACGLSSALLCGVKRRDGRRPGGLEFVPRPRRRCRAPIPRPGARLSRGVAAFADIKAPADGTPGTFSRVTG